MSGFPSRQGGEELHTYSYYVINYSVDLQVQTEAFSAPSATMKA